MRIMEIQLVTKAQVAITFGDLQVMALVVLKLGQSDHKIAAIKTLRDLVRDLRPIEADGMPIILGDGTPGLDGVNVLDTFGLKECKDAIDSWFENRRFIA